MTLTLRIVLIVASIFVVFYTIRKIRKSQLNIDDSVFWIGFSVMLLIMSIFPQVVTFFTQLLGIASPVNFVFLFVIFLIIIKLFKLAIDLSITKHRLNHLIQRIAIINHDVEKNTQRRLNGDEGNGEDSEGK